MSLEITVGPPHLLINQGRTVLVTEPDGSIPWPSDKGLYVRDTRLISSWLVYANGSAWELLNSGNVTYFASRIFLTNRQFVTEDREVTARTLSLSIGRSIVDGAMHEDLDVINHALRPVRFNLEIAMRSDFADIFEVKSGRIVRRGRINTAWSNAPARLAATYRNGAFRREIVAEPRNNDSPAVFANGRISFEIELAPDGIWHSCLEYVAADGDRQFAAPKHCIDRASHEKHAHHLAEWQETVLKLTTSNEELYRLFRQAIDDMASLRLPVEGTDQLKFVPAAGAPWFVTLFGRDSLVVSLQNAMVYPKFARGALDVLARFQAAEEDPYRDAEPGKILHELRTGELAQLKLIPHTPYYGTADATPLYLVVFHTAWRWTGDPALLERHLDTAERCLEWIDRYGDRDGDGFQEYETRSAVGYENQGWKDAGDSVVYSDGTPVRGPKALCELQGYVFDAWNRMAEIYDFLGRNGKAAELRRKARELCDRFNETFWDEESGFYAYCLDGEKRKVLTVASNPGHCLWSGIVPKERARRVVERLMRPDMWSGWGIRTLSSDNPAYNPYSYQNGSVWPHDNGFIALGFKRYGFADEAARVARDISEAGSFFMLHQLPELYAGIARTADNFPVQYLGANVPQAWAAGSVFSLLQAILGFVPDAPRGKLYVDPTLPRWLPDLVLRDLRLGEHKFALRFWRDGERSEFEVLSGEASIIERRAMAEASDLTARTTI